MNTNIIARLLSFTLLSLSIASAYNINVRVWSKAAIPKKVTSPSTHKNRVGAELKHHGHFNNRRDFLSSTLALVTVAPLISQPEPAHALQSRDEKLCGTGLFEHFQEYRCTQIGNILDEGTSKDLSSAEKGSTDSLMSKLGVSVDDLNMDTDMNMNMNMNTSIEDGKGSKAKSEKSKSKEKSIYK